MGKILNIFLFSISFILLSCDTTNNSAIEYSLSAGSEESVVRNNKVIDKPAVFLLQLEANNGNPNQYDTDVIGSDMFSFSINRSNEFKFKLHNSLDSVSIRISNQNGETLLSLNQTTRDNSVSLEPGVYNCIVENLKNDGELRRIFYKPDFESIDDEFKTDPNKLAEYSIFTENDCIDCNLEDGIFNQIDFSNGNYSNSSFSGSTLSNSNFRNSILNYSNFINSVADSVDFTNSSFEETEDFRHASFINSKFDSVQIDEMNAKFSNFYSTSFVTSTLTNSSFTEADLFNVDFTDAILDGTDFNNALLSFADFINTSLLGVNLCGAEMDGISFRNIKYDNSTTCLPDSLKN